LNNSIYGGIGFGEEFDKNIKTIINDSNKLLKIYDN